MKLGIVGLPNVGKSTLFNSLTKAGALAANYPFATIDPNVGVVSVPDDRIVKLGELYTTKKVTHAVIGINGAKMINATKQENVNIILVMKAALNVMAQK